MSTKLILTKMRLAILCCFLALLIASESALGQQRQQQIRQSANVNCVFVGCSCGEDADMEIANSQEAAADDNEDAVSASSVQYEISCRDQRDPSLRLKSFPLRDRSRRYSNRIASLELNDNDIESVPANQFDRLEVDVADLSTNNIRTIDANAFNGIQKLEILDLSKNHLRDLDDDLFTPVESTLVQLKLGSNELGHMDVSKLGNILSRLNRLTFLGLRHNHLQQVPDLSKMNRLEELSFESNRLESLGEENGQNLLPSTLYDLKLENNRLKQINDNTFANLKNLKYLNLASNQIASISENAFTQLARLKHLNLRKNHLKHVPSRMIFYLVNLERLDLSSQNQVLKQVEDYAFDRQSNAHTLAKVDLSNNRIMSIENKAFCSRNRSHPYVNIKEIDLAGNPVQSINACILRQIAKGFHDIKHHHNHILRAKVSFKASSQLTETPAQNLKCDCEVTKSATLVDLDGECENSDGTLIQLKNYKCNNDAASKHDSVELGCLNTPVYDCAAHSHAPSQSGAQDNSNAKPLDKPTSSHGGGGSGGGKGEQQTSNINEIDRATSEPAKTNNNNNNNPNKNNISKGPSAIGSNARRLAASSSSSSYFLCSFVLLAATASLRSWSWSS